MFHVAFTQRRSLKYIVGVHIPRSVDELEQLDLVHTLNAYHWILTIGSQANVPSMCSHTCPRARAVSSLRIGTTMQGGPKTWTGWGEPGQGWDRGKPGPGSLCCS